MDQSPKMPEATEQITEATRSPSHSFEDEKDIIVGHADYHGIDTRALHLGADEVYEKKVALLNEALIDIGMNSFQWKVFAMTGFGWFVDNFWMQAITIISPAVQREFAVQRIAFLTVAKYVGLVIGSTLWPMTADFIGRRPAFNITLLISAVSGLVGGGSPNFVAIATFCAFIGVGTGGNQPVDSAIFLEYIPATHQYLLTMQSAFWSVGAAVVALVGWPLIANYSCAPTGPCGFNDNLGWRYSYWTFGGLTLVMFFARFAFRIYETPKYLLGKGLDAQAVDVVAKVAARCGKASSLSLEDLEAIDAQFAVRRGGSTDAPPNALSKNIMRRNVAKFSPEKIKALFSTPRLAFSTCMLIFLWCAIGMAYPLYNSFIPLYLQAKGVQYGSTSLNQTYRNYAIQAVCGIPASIIGGFTVEMKHIGRKGTGTLACICTGVFLFLFTRATTNASVLGFTCAIAFFQNLVYGLLYSYTPELFPAPIRGTGNGLVALFNRLSGLMAPIIAAYVGIDTDVPIWISASLFVVAGFCFLVMPYEMRGRAAT